MISAIVPNKAEESDLPQLFKPQTLNMLLQHTDVYAVFSQWSDSAFLCVSYSPVNMDTAARSVRETASVSKRPQCNVSGLRLYHRSSQTTWRKYTWDTITSKSWRSFVDAILLFRIKTLIYLIHLFVRSWNICFLFILLFYFEMCHIIRVNCQFIVQECLSLKPLYCNFSLIKCIYLFITIISVGFKQICLLIHSFFLIEYPIIILYFKSLLYLSILNGLIYKRINSQGMKSIFIFFYILFYFEMSHYRGQIGIEFLNFRIPFP